ncbi:marvel domain-containing protein [Biscogniauxia mediterranea]|nr:marvel domain-containing protein [Biscogniauxia mediterranea]
MLDLWAIATRTILLAKGGYVLGMSILLALHQRTGPIPIETGMSCFMGGLGVLVSTVGFVSLWLDKPKATVLMGLDAVVSLLYLASAIALVMALRDVPSCVDLDEFSTRQRLTNQILNGGCLSQVHKTGRCDGTRDPNGEDDTTVRCNIARSSYVFQFLACVCCLMMIGVGHVIARRGGIARVGPSGRRVVGAIE